MPGKKYRLCMWLPWVPACAGTTPRRICKHSDRLQLPDLGYGGITNTGALCEPGYGAWRPPVLAWQMNLRLRGGGARGRSPDFISISSLGPGIECPLVRVHGVLQRLPAVRDIAPGLEGPAGGYELRWSAQYEAHRMEVVQVDPGVAGQRQGIVAGGGVQVGLKQTGVAWPRVAGRTRRGTWRKITYGHFMPILPTIVAAHGRKTGSSSKLTQIS